MVTDREPVPVTVMLVEPAPTGVTVMVFDDI
jgi:hypothetical protein